MDEWNFNRALTGQFRAGLAMLRKCVDLYPDGNIRSHSRNMRIWGDRPGRYGLGMLPQTRSLWPTLPLPQLPPI